MTAVIYQITNKVDGKSYVGVTRFTPEHRWTQHKYNARRLAKTHLHHAINKYGVDNFEVKAVASCVGDWSEAERQVIKSLAPEYNMTNGGEITVGRRASKETVEKIRQGNLGKKRTAEQNLANSLNKKQQYVERPELLRKTIESIKVAKSLVNEEKRIAAVKLANTGKTWSMTEEIKAKQLANLNTPEARAKSVKSKCKKVLCTTTGKVYESLISASALLGIHFGSISNVCLGKRPHTHHLQFKYLS